MMFERRHFRRCVLPRPTDGSSTRAIAPRMSRPPERGLPQRPGLGESSLPPQVEADRLS